MKKLLAPFFRPHSLLAIIVALAALPVSSPAQNVPALVQTIDHVAGPDMAGPVGLAYSPRRGLLYATGRNRDGSAFKLVSTATNLAVADPGNAEFGSSPTVRLLAFDTAGARYYQLNPYNHNIIVCDAATDTVLNVIDLSGAGNAPLNGFAINSATNTLFVSQGYDTDATGSNGKVIVVNAATGAITATLAVNTFPQSIAVDEGTNRIFVNTIGPSYDASATDKSTQVVNVVDGASLSVSAISIPLATGKNPFNSPHTAPIAVNPQTHRVYAAVNYADATTGHGRAFVAVLDGVANNVTTQIELVAPSFGAQIQVLSVDQATNRIFAGGSFYLRGSLWALDGASNTVAAVIRVTPDQSAYGEDDSLTGLADDPANGRVYALGGTRIFAVDVNLLTVVPGLMIPLDDRTNGDPGSNQFRSQQKSAVDPGLNRLFTFNGSSHALTVLDLNAGQTIANLPVTTPRTGSSAPGCVALNTVSHAVFASSPYLDAVDVFDGANLTRTATITVSGKPRELAVDSTRNLVYVSTIDGLVVIDGSTNTVINTITGVASRGHDPSFADDHTSVAVNPVTNRIYVMGFGPSQSNRYALELDVIDGASRTIINRVNTAPATVSVNTGTLAINTVTNKIYLANTITGLTNQQAPVGLYEIDGATNAVRAILPPSNGFGGYTSLDNAALAVNTDLNRVYVAYNSGGNFNRLYVYDVGAGTYTGFDSASFVPVLAFDPTRDRLYNTIDPGYGNETRVYSDQPYVAPAFFNGQVALGNGVYYLSFDTGNYFGYYSFLTDPHYVYHFDLGYEYVFDSNAPNGGVYLYDFKSGGFFYTSPTFPFPYLYDFTLNSTLYYYPDPKNAGHYNTDGIRYFYEFANGQIISK